jgi:SAM-dependent methyltransferase
MGDIQMQETKSPNVATDRPMRQSVFERTRYAPSLPQEEFIVPLLRREIESCIERYATPARGAAKAIDIGCGGQPFRTLLEQVGYTYCGVDVNPGGGPPVDVVCAADEPLPGELLRRGPFDFLLCTEVVEHMADWHGGFANFAMLLAPGGRALITAPYFYQLHEEPYDFWRPTLHAIDYYARRAGLQTLYRQPAGDGWDVLGTLLATCKFVPTSTRFGDRVLAKTIRVASRWMFRAILRGKLQPRVRAEAPLYLSNVVVLEKSQCG